MTLKQFREARGISQKTLSTYFRNGCTAGRISQIEGLENPDEQTRQDYLVALERAATDKGRILKLVSEALDRVKAL